MPSTIEDPPTSKDDDLSPDDAVKPDVLDDVVRIEPGGAKRAVRRGRHARAPRLPWNRPWFVALVLVAALPALFFGFSIVGALRTPGNYSFKAKWADWLREHHSELIVRELENVYFKTKSVKKGGTVEKLHALPGVDPTVSTSVAGPKVTVPDHIDRPKRVELVVSPAVPGEGEWQPTGPLTGGLPGMFVSQFRADTEYTSQITSAVWIDTKLMRVRLMPGQQEPSGTWDTPSLVTGDEALTKIAAAFNGGFRFQDARGGIFLEGREAVPLVDGAASMVVYKDGRIDIGAWNRDVKMTGEVESVLQNLTLMVDGGVLDERIGHNDTSQWGATLHASIAVARSGIGVTKDGALVYVAGPALTAKSLGESLMRAGAVRAMTLDINPEWVTFNFFQHPDPASPTTVKGDSLYPELQRSPDRYLSPESRDFFTISQR